MTEAMLPQLPNFSGQQLSNTIYAHAFLGIRPSSEFLDRFLQVSLARMKSRDAAPQWISNTVWALASMDLHPGTVWLDTFQVRRCADTRTVGWVVLGEWESTSRVLMGGGAVGKRSCGCGPRASKHLRSLSMPFSKITFFSSFLLSLSPR